MDNRPWVIVYSHLDVHMEAAVIIQPMRIETQGLPLPEPATSELLVRVMVSGICGTDEDIFQREYLGS